MMKRLFLVPMLLLFVHCSTQKTPVPNDVNKTLDAWHLAAAQARFDDYFNLMTRDAVFIGTDASENWQVAAFKEFSKPYFDSGKAWSFIALQRNVYSSNGVVYFDELLDTQMGICRGSGVLKLDKGRYKIAHYVLSIAVPNEHVDSLTALKKNWDKDYAKKALLKLQ
jgi:hypothetical protein